MKTLPIFKCWHLMILMFSMPVFAQNFKEDFGTGFDTFNMPSGSTTQFLKSGNEFNCPPDLPYDGTYVITANNGQDFNGSLCGLRTQGDLLYPGWHKTIKDHTGNTNGRFMLVNADSNKSEIYRRTVSGLVVGNTYDFSVWVANILNPATACSPANPVNLMLEIYNGTSLIAEFSTGDIIAQSNTSNIWKEYKLNFKTSSSNINIVISSKGKGGCGNDLAIDDITFSTISCSNNVQVSIAVPTMLTCAISSVYLDGSASSSGPNINYQWSTTDGIIAGATNSKLVVTRVGTYTLTVTDLSSPNCPASSSVVVASNTQDVKASIAKPAILGCSNPTVVLDGSASSSGSNIVYEWSTKDGNIAGATNSKKATVTMEGTYILTVTDLTSPNCPASNYVEVVSDISIPIVSIAQPVMISETNPTVVLDGSASESGANIVYLWTASNGGVINSGSTTNKISVSSPGNYTLTVTNNSSGCADSKQVTVTSNNLSAESFSIKNLNFTPNPTQGKITFTEKVEEVKVFDLSGRLVKSITVNTSEVDLSDLQNGVYALQATQNQKVLTVKVVKE